METKLERIADKSAREAKPIFMSLYHLLNEELLLKCHHELAGNKAVGVDEMTKEEYSRKLEENIRILVKMPNLKAGILEEGEYKASEGGSIQGEIISPMLANIYMHHVLVH